MEKIDYRKFDKEFILGNLLPREHVISSGIYFLVKNKEIVYVGKSKNIVQRVSQHAKEETKDFDSLFCFRVPESELELTENFYITKFKPKYNKVCLRDVKVENIRMRVKRLLKNKNSIKLINNMPNYVKNNYTVVKKGGIYYTKEEVIFKIADKLNGTIRGGNDE